MKKRKVDIAVIVLPVILILFTLFVYAPISVYVGNQSEYFFSLWDFLPQGLLMGLAGGAAAVLIYLLLRGRGRDAWAAAVFAVGVLLLLQGNFLNPDYGTLDGRGVKWDQYTGYAVANTAVWLALIAVAVVVMLKKRDMMRSLIRYGSILLTAYQVVMLVMLLFTTPITWQPQDWVVSDVNSTTLSSNDNTVVFLVDACDTNYFQRVLDEDPELLEGWDGFVYYPDFVSAYSKTRMSLTYILSRQWYENDRTIRDYVNAAYDDVPLLDELAAADYDIGIYTQSVFVSGSLAGRVSNILPVRQVISSPFGLAGQMLKLSCFSYGPHLLKPYFEFYTEDFDVFYAAEDGGKVYSKNNYEFAQRAAGELQLTDRNAFRFYHIVGSHFPCDMDADGNFVGVWQSNAYDQTRGVFKTILNPFMEQMKRLGIYDDATIVIMADHGRFDEGISYPTFVIKRPGAHGPVATCDTPASHAELHATLLQCAGLPVPEGQTSIFDLDPDADYQRRYLYYPTSHDNGGYLPDLKEYMVGPGPDAHETGRLLTREGVVEAGE